jgi:hypothetical protein
MEKVCFSVLERCDNQYQLVYDEKKLESLGYKSIKEYIEKEMNFNPFMEDKNGVVIEVGFDNMVDILDTDFSTLEFC